jgi:alpha(1,3/1,4) fucosyltransferase
MMGSYMHIAISFRPQPTIFGSGQGQAVIALAEMYKGQGDQVTLVNYGQGEWWADAEGLEFERRRIGARGDPFDVFVDVGGALGSDQRTGTKNVILFRSDPSFDALEKASYVQRDGGPDLNGVHEVWVWDALVPEGRTGIISTLFNGLPVVRIPYVWTSSILKNYLRLEGLEDKPSSSLDVLHIAEKNTTNTSSCVVPFVESKGWAKPIRLFNASHLETDPFFQTNLAGTSFKSSEISYEGRERYVDWLGIGCIVATHGRFVPFRSGLLDLVWLGIPFVHNCEMLRDAGMGLELGYYSENDMGGVLERFDLAAWNRGRLARRAWLETRFAPRKELRVGFVDMWHGFDAADNFFVDLMQQHAEKNVQVVGVSDIVGVSLIIRGPFGSTSIPAGVPVVYFSGEREDERELNDPNIRLFLTHGMRHDEQHIRLPLWPLFINWFGNQSKPLRNPNGLPLEYALKPYDGPKPDFCAFLVSNPNCSERNAAFDALNAYKRVDSGGAYKNNMGGPIPCKFGGGGGGDLAKFDFFKTHTFALCYENSIAPGYVTEKLLHAKMAGCIPLYRGAAESVKDFDPSGFIFVGDGQDVVDIVKELERNPKKLAAMAAVPALSPSRYLRTKGLLNMVGKRLVELAKSASLASASLARSTSLASTNQIIIEKPLVDPTKLPGSPLFLSFATTEYLPSLNNLLQSIQALRAKDPTVRARVYLGQDVSGTPERWPWVEFRPLPSLSPVEGFPDFFKPDQFGWKLWLLRQTCADADLEGDLILYTDAGASWISLPTEMLQNADQRGLCLLRDRNNINRFWCSPDMVQTMSVTEKELAEFQCQAGAIAFRAGAPEAQAFFEEAYTWGSKKECLFGPKWITPTSGHRHDQSILSVLSIRRDTPMVEAARNACIVSLRKAYQRGTPMYHHRGRPVVHIPVLLGIDDVWVISLDRRPDRYAAWMKEYADLATVANRLPAIDGRELQLTENLYRLFAKNDFKWKKSVTGCALSHILLWAQLASEHPMVNNYLILEDDHRWRSAGWRAELEAAITQAPADAELLLLGGVLPGNRAGYDQLFQPVNDVWGVIQPNNLFTGEQGPLIPFFHFCAYSYVLTRAGAKKLLAGLETFGCYTSIDNFLCHPRQGLIKYSMKKLIAGCFQDEDPVYQKAQFDEFLRVDSYDSDIWNNKECFDVTTFASVETGRQSLWPCLVDILQSQPHSIQTRNTLREESVSPKSSGTLVYFFGQVKTDGLMEEDWLKALCPTITYQPVPVIRLVQPNAFLLVARPHVAYWKVIMRELDIKGIPFRVLHLSDEDCKDPIDFYSYKSCTRVVRNYFRPGLDEKVVTIPLGHGLGMSGPSGVAGQHQPTRDLIWSFHGSNEAVRRPLLEPLLALQPNSCRFIPSFRHESMTSPTEYRSILLRSKFVPILKGQTFETFRLYEALELGCIPLYVRSEGDEVYWSWLRSHLTLIELKSWDQAVKLIGLLEAEPSKAQQYRDGLIAEGLYWKGESRTAFALDA